MGGVKTRREYGELEYWCDLGQIVLRKIELARQKTSKEPQLN